MTCAAGSVHNPPPGGFHFARLAAGLARIRRAVHEGFCDGQHLVRLGAVDRARAGCRFAAGLGRSFGSLARDHYRRDRRQPRRHAAHSVGELSRWVRGDPVDLSCGRRDRCQGHSPAFRFDDGDRRSRLLCALSRRPRLGAFHLGLAMAAGADRRHCAVDDLGRGCLCGHGGNRVQRYRDRQNNPGGLFHQ